MPGFLCSAYLAVAAFQLQATPQTLRIEVQYLEWKRPIGADFFIGALAKLPEGASASGSINVSIELGKKFHTEGRIGSETLAANGVTRPTNANEIEIEIEPEYSKENSPAGAEAKDVAPGRDAWRVHATCRLKLGHFLVMRFGRATDNKGLTTTMPTGFAVRVLSEPHADGK
jgi:hypothetical protein